VRRALLTTAAALLLAGCSDNGDPTPQAEPTVVPTTAAAPLQGPTAGPTVALGAFVSPGDLGERWASGAAAALPCRPAFRHDAMRSVGLVEERGRLTETIATGVDIPAVVAAWRGTLAGCRYDVRDDDLGDAGITALSADGEDRVLITGTEGVLIVMHASGDLADESEELASWADLALGTSCVAAADGCH